MTEASQTIRLDSGRALGYAEYGDLAGKTVFHFNASGGSRLERPTDETILTDLGIRFVTTDRPGHGMSDPQPDRQLLDWPNDIAQLADHLGVERFYVMGWSAGGPHALACAYKMPERVLAGALVSGLAPPDRPNPYEGLPIPNRSLMFFGRRFPGVVYLVRRLLSRMVVRDLDQDVSKIASFYPPVDWELVLETSSERALAENIQEGYRQGWKGPAQDDIIINSPWGFRLEDIKPRIDIWQGDVDENVPLNQDLYQDEKIPNSRLTVLEGQAHLYLLVRWREILAALVQ